LALLRGVIAKERVLMADLCGLVGPSLAGEVVAPTGTL
jgi:hypothetical protein